MALGNSGGVREDPCKRSAEVGGEKEEEEEAKDTAATVPVQLRPVLSPTILSSMSWFSCVGDEAKCERRFLTWSHRASTTRSLLL